jgi:hypothetical protein
MSADQTVSPPEKGSGGREGLRDQISATLLMVVVAVFWWDSYSINAAEAQMFPRFTLIVLGLLTVMLFIRGMRLGATRSNVPVISSWPAFLAFMLPTVLYAVGVSYFGFFTSSVVYIPLVAYLVGLRKHWLNAIVTFVFLLVTWLVFVALFSRPLPPEIFWG